jgi:hypothetical protein
LLPRLDTIDVQVWIELSFNRFFPAYKSGPLKWCLICEATYKGILNWGSQAGNRSGAALFGGTQSVWSGQPPSASLNYTLPRTGRGVADFRRPKRRVTVSKGFASKGNRWARHPKQADAYFAKMSKWGTPF